MNDVTLPLHAGLFTDVPRVIAASSDISASTFRYPSGVEALRLETPRGHVIVLPFLGQMIWEAVFDGRNLGMGSLFPQPRHGASILDTYGALAYHAGVLRNGTPGPADTHPLHGEMPTMRFDAASLVFGRDQGGAFVELVGQVDHTTGFGPAYRATPRLRLGADQALIEVEMVVQNRSAHPMELMYMLHANFAFVADARIHQPAPYDPAHVVVRRAVPSHVVPSDAFLQLLADLGDTPARMETLSEPDLYSPEQVFYIKGLGVDAAGVCQQVMELPEGDAFSVAYRPADFPHCVRWIFNDGDAQVAAFALPSTCEPEGYTAEKAKGHVRLLQPAEMARFPVTFGYLDAREARAAISSIHDLGKARP